jgi:hypothetical protein
VVATVERLAYGLADKLLAEHQAMMKWARRTHDVCAVAFAQAGLDAWDLPPIPEFAKIPVHDHAKARATELELRWRCHADRMHAQRAMEAEDTDAGFVPPPRCADFAAPAEATTRVAQVQTAAVGDALAKASRKQHEVVELLVCAVRDCSNQLWGWECRPNAQKTFATHDHLTAMVEYDLAQLTYLLESVRAAPLARQTAVELRVATTDRKTGPDLGAEADAVETQTDDVKIADPSAARHGSSQTQPPATRGSATQCGATTAECSQSPARVGTPLAQYVNEVMMRKYDDWRWGRHSEPSRPPSPLPPNQCDAATTSIDWAAFDSVEAAQRREIWFDEERSRSVFHVASLEGWWELRLRNAVTAAVAAGIAQQSLGAPPPAPPAPAQHDAPQSIMRAPQQDCAAVPHPVDPVQAIHAAAEVRAVVVAEPTDAAVNRSLDGALPTLDRAVQTDGEWSHVPSPSAEPDETNCVPTFEHTSAQTNATDTRAACHQTTAAVFADRACLCVPDTNHTGTDAETTETQSVGCSTLNAMFERVESEVQASTSSVDAVVQSVPIMTHTEGVQVNTLAPPKFAAPAQGHVEMVDEAVTARPALADVDVGCDLRTQQRDASTHLGPVLVRTATVFTQVAVQRREASCHAAPVMQDFAVDWGHAAHGEKTHWGGQASPMMTSVMLQCTNHTALRTRASWTREDSYFSSRDAATTTAVAAVAAMYPIETTGLPFQPIDWSRRYPLLSTLSKLHHSPGAGPPPAREEESNPSAAPVVATAIPAASFVFTDRCDTFTQVDARPDTDENSCGAEDRGTSPITVGTDTCAASAQATCTCADASTDAALTGARADVAVQTDAGAYSPSSVYDAPLPSDLAVRDVATAFSHTRATTASTHLFGLSRPNSVAIGGFDGSMTTAAAARELELLRAALAEDDEGAVVVESPPAAQPVLDDPSALPPERVHDLLHWRKPNAFGSSSQLRHTLSATRVAFGSHETDAASPSSLSEETPDFTVVPEATLAFSMIARPLPRATTFTAHYSTPQPRRKAVRPKHSEFTSDPVLLRAQWASDSPTPSKFGDDPCLPKRVVEKSHVRINRVAFALATDNPVMQKVSPPVVKALGIAVPEHRRPRPHRLVPLPGTEAPPTQPVSYTPTMPNVPTYDHM